MVQLIVYTTYVLLRSAILIAMINRLFLGVFGILSGAIIMLGSIIEYFLFCTMIRKISDLEKSQKNHGL